MVGMGFGLGGGRGHLGFEALAEGGVEVSAAEDDGYFVGFGKLVGVEEGGGEGDGAAGLGDEPGDGQDDAHGGEDLVFGDGDDTVDKVQDMLEVEDAEALGAEAVADGSGGLGGGPLDEGFGVEAFLGVSGELRLDSPDLNAGVGESGCGGKLDGGGDAAEQAAAADGGENQVDGGELLDDFEAAGGLPGDDLGGVVGWNHGVAVEGDELFGFEAPVGGGGADLDDLGTQCASSGFLDLGGVAGHDDDGAGSEGAGGVGYALGVVAAGVGDDAAVELFGRKLRDHVVGSAKLEAADGLLALGFDVEVEVGLGKMGHAETGAGNAVEGRSDGYAGDAFAGGLYVSEGYEFGHGGILNS